MTARARAEQAGEPRNLTGSSPKPDRPEPAPAPRPPIQAPLPSARRRRQLLIRPSAAPSQTLPSTAAQCALPVGTPCRGSGAFGEKAVDGFMGKFRFARACLRRGAQALVELEGQA